MIKSEMICNSFKKVNVIPTIYSGRLVCTSRKNESKINILIININIFNKNFNIATDLKKSINRL